LLGVQDGRGCTTGLASLGGVRELRLEHVKVTCLPPALQELRLTRCRLGPSPQLEAGTRLRALTLAACTGQVPRAPAPRAFAPGSQQDHHFLNLLSAALSLVWNN
jgi:hypothetical protein